MNNSWRGLWRFGQRGWRGGSWSLRVSSLVDRPQFPDHVFHFPLPIQSDSVHRLKLHLFIMLFRPGLLYQLLHQLLYQLLYQRLRVSIGSKGSKWVRKVLRVMLVKTGFFLNIFETKARKARKNSTAQKTLYTHYTQGRYSRRALNFWLSLQMNSNQKPSKA